MSLPHLARNAVRYDPTHHVVHAIDWNGAPLQLQTPAELLHAIDTGHCYAPNAVIAAGVALCHAHGVAPDTLPLSTLEPLLLPLSTHPADDVAAALVTCMQRLDRAHERAARLAVAVCTTDDILVIVDDDGLFAQTLMRILAREHDMPAVQVIHVHHQQGIPSQASIVLVVGVVDEQGNSVVRGDLPAVPHYVVASCGPNRTPTPAPTAQYPAVITARGMYRPDRITHYYRDGDTGGDVIPLA